MMSVRTQLTTEYINHLIRIIISKVLFANVSNISREIGWEERISLSLIF